MYLSQGMPHGQPACWEDTLQTRAGDLLLVGETREGKGERAESRWSGVRVEGGPPVRTGVPGEATLL